MDYYIINYGLGGGFGGANEYEVIVAVNLPQAENVAFLSACETYESYEGLHGLRTEAEIMEEEECDEFDASQIYDEERDDWLEYTAYLFTKEAEERIGSDLDNSFKEETDKLTQLRNIT